MLLYLIWIVTSLFFGTLLDITNHGFELNQLPFFIQGLLTLLLFCSTLLTSYGLGWYFIRKIPELTTLEETILSTLIGFAILANGILLIGLLGFMTPKGIFSWVTLAGFISSYILRKHDRFDLNQLRLPHPINFKSWGLFEILVFPSLVFLFLITLAKSFAPVRDYDALMYHLEIPKHFLKNGIITFDPAIWRSAYPMLSEMLFSIGIIYQLEPFTQVLSLSFCVLFLLSIFSFGKRFFDSKIGLLAVGIILGNPAIPIYASSPSVEFLWGSYEFGAIYLFTIWANSKEDERTGSGLAIVGVLSGFAASVKYLSFPIIFSLGAMIYFISTNNHEVFSKKVFRYLIAFGSAMILTIAPWYLKNWIWTGNPFYPLFFGGIGWTSLNQELFVKDYLGSFGTGRSMLDYLTIPINIYFAQPRFSTLKIEFLPPLLWMALGFPFLLPNKKYTHLLIYLGFGLFLWAYLSQVIRFLLPMSALISILAAFVIYKMPKRINLWTKVVIVGGLLIISCLIQWRLFQESPLPDLIRGNITTNQYLENVVSDQKAVRFIQSNLSASEKVLFLWDGQGYYCDSQCLPDDDENIAIQLTISPTTPQSLADQLKEQGINYLFISRPNALWFVKYHDPNNRHRDALIYFDSTFFPACGKSIFMDGTMELFQIIC